MRYDDARRASRCAHIVLGSLIAVTAACSRETSAPVATSPQSFEALARASLSQIEGTLALSGLTAPVEVVRDTWGVPHIYAANVDDLFFAEGFVVAQDRLWQMEMSRRVSQGRVAEISGPSAFAHDRLVRMLRFRGPFDEAEWTSYHPEAKRIFTAYVNGVNAFIAHAGDNLPVEFKLTGIRPEPWKPEEILVRARVTAAIASARSELRLAQAVAKFGAAEANRRAKPDPYGDLRVPEGLDVSIVTDAVLASLEGNLYGDFPDVEILPEFRQWPGATKTTASGAPETSPGSNNWAVRTALSKTGTAIMVDDPHREVTLPAWRYLVHLEAPGWSVAGATEPGLPGVIRGHNGRVAWGRTATGTDEADVFVEELNPENPNEVRWNGRWEALETVTETIAVKGEPPRSVTFKIGRHGPIFHEDVARNRAYALRSSLLERGTAEYIGGLRMDQASSARDCLTNADFMKSPPTNLVCADAEGHVTFRVSAAAPKRNGWDGRLPVPGTGRYEWEGLRTDLPQEENPARGFIATANNNIHPPGFKNPLFFNGRAPYWRHRRIAALLSRGGPFGIEEMRVMLRDSFKEEAAQLKPWFEGWQGSQPDVERARAALVGWDAVMRKESTPAAIYMTWRGAVDLDALRAMQPAERRRATEAALRQAVETLAARQGTDWNEWRWGRMHQSVFKHQLVSAYDLPTVERDGGADTVNATGAVYRLITNFAEPDASLVTIAPGVSGQPGSPFYGNLLEGWVRGEFFQLAYTRAAVERAAKYTLRLDVAQP